MNTAPLEPPSAPVLALIFVAIVLVMVVLCLPQVTRLLSRSSPPPPTSVPSGVTIDEWITDTVAASFVPGTETAGRCARVVAVADTECEFGLRHEQVAPDVGWPMGFPLVGSLRLERAGIVRVTIQTTRLGYALFLLIGQPRAVRRLAEDAVAQAEGWQRSAG